MSNKPSTAEKMLVNFILGIFDGLFKNPKHKKRHHF